MLIAFICISAFLVLIALVFVIWPLVTKRRDEGEANRRELNLAVLRQQYAELEAEHAAGRVPDDEFEETRSEIEARVLEETRSADEVEQKGGRQGQYAAFALAVLIPVSAFLIYLEIGAPIAMDPDFTRQQRQMMAAQGGHSDAEILEQIAILEERLKEQPDNPDGWMMLARTQASFKNWAKSAEAFEQVNRLVPDNPDVMADWADVLAAAQGGSLDGRPREIIEAVLKIDPTHWKALALMGTLCYNKQDYKGAVQYWTRMLAGVEKGSEEWRQIAENIEQARHLGGLPPSENASLLAAQAAPDAAKSPAAAQKFIDGSVEVAPELKDKVGPNDVVFIYARPIEGSKMPVAFMRIKASELPATFHLDSSSTMGMGMKTLNEVDEVIVEARVSRSGNFMPASGDLEGTVEGKVAVGKQSVKVIINRVLP